MSITYYWKRVEPRGNSLPIKLKQIFERRTVAGSRDQLGPELAGYLAGIRDELSDRPECVPVINEMIKTLDEGYSIEVWGQ